MRKYNEACIADLITSITSNKVPLLRLCKLNMTLGAHEAPSPFFLVKKKNLSIFTSAMTNLFKSGSTKPEVVRSSPHTGERSKAFYRENTEEKHGN